MKLDLNRTKIRTKIVGLRSLILSFATLQS